MKRMKRICGRSCRKATGKGYMEILYPCHPKANKHGWVAYHRMVMELFLDRYLELGEIVHHINGDKEDNRIENLELIKNQSEHQKHHFKQDPITGKLMA